MKPRLALVTALTLALVAVPVDRAAASAPQDSGVIVLQPVAHDVGGSLSHFPQADRSLEASHRALPLRAGGGKPGGGGGGSSDGALQGSAATPAATVAGSVNVDGVGASRLGGSNCCTPADTNLAVGTTQVVQWVNLSYAVFSKTTGALIGGPFAGNTIWSGFGGGCDVNNDGDPIVKFDAQNQRWLMTQFSVSTQPYLQCVAVSSSADFATSTWNRYAYSFGTNFPDYPKVGIWPDAYYFSFNMFANGSRFSGAAACALDSAKARAGTSASMLCFQNGSSVGSLLPADLDGATGATGTTAAPPAGTAAYFANFGSNSLNLWRFHADFGTPSSSTFTGPSTIATAAFTSACGGGTCIPQANTSQKLDSLADRLMYRLSYRNFGTYRSLVVTHSVTGSGTSAPRWYELRDPGTGTMAIAQQSSYAPDATYRWMGSAAQDKQGNLAVGYSASSSSISPQIRYAGRLAADPSSTLRAEVTALSGTGSDTGPYSRWGDYSSLSLDPVDDCTFWYTTMYLPADGSSFSWNTRIVNFKFSTCN